MFTQGNTTVIYGFRLLLLGAALFFMSTGALAFQGYVQPYDHNATIAWGNGEVAVVRALEQTGPDDAVATSALALRKAATSARKQMLDMILSVRIDGKRTVSAFLSEDDEMAARVRGVVQNSPMEQAPQSGAGGTVRVSERLRGKLAELILPTTIPFQSGIPPKLSTSMEQNLSVELETFEEAGNAAGGYTGIIVDARGLQVTPALAPVIYGQDGVGAYGPFLVSRQSAIDKGVIAYATTAAPAALRSRVGSRPLVVKGLSVFGSWRTDILVSTPMARMIRGVMRGADALKHCRAVIVIDAPTMESAKQIGHENGLSVEEQ